LSTKIHAAGDALGNPVRLIGSPGQRNDIAFAHQLVEGFAAGVTIADKGYDADHLCDRIAQTGGQSVIPAQTKLDVQTFLRRRALPRTPLIVWTTTFTLFLLYD
jgi:putative transposase